MTREAFERLCFGDYCVPAPRASWYSRPGEPHLARLRGGFDDAFRPVPGRKTHFVADEVGEYDRVFTYANPERVTWGSEWRRTARTVRRVFDMLDADDACRFEFGFGAVQQPDGRMLMTHDEAVYRALQASERTSAIYGGSYVTVERVDTDRGIITVRR